MHQSHFITNSWGESGYTWTLTTRLGDMLLQAERLYGPRDQSWTPLGVEFGPDTPQNWYPGTGKHVAIQLSKNALNDPAIACYQLAHECIHLLSPLPGPVAPVLEEGLATVFSEYYVFRHFGQRITAVLPSYQDAADKVRKLIDAVPDAVKLLRQVEPCFKRMSPATFLAAGIDCFDAEFIQELLCPFVR